MACMSMKLSENSYTPIVINEKPILYLMIGAPGSGKSYWATNHMAQLNAAYVSRDAIRFHLLQAGEDYFSHEDETYDIFLDSIIDSIKKGQNVIADATHLSRGSRKKLIWSLAARECYGQEYDIIYIVVDTPYEVCAARNAERKGRARVPTEQLEGMFNAFKSHPVEKDEFFNEIGVWYV